MLPPIEEGDLVALERGLPLRVRTVRPGTAYPQCRTLAAERRTVVIGIARR